MHNRFVSAVAAWVSGCVVAVGLCGCCSHHSCSGEPAAKGVEPQSDALQPVPGALQYPRFHPVPTRPVFLPDGIEPLPVEPQAVSTAPTAPASPTVPNTLPDDGWRPAAK